MEKTGLILCSGCGIGDALDFDAISEVATENGAATTLIHECLCAHEGLEALKATVPEHELDGVLVCACSERAKTEEFASLGFDAASMYRIALREHCTWSHPAGEEDTQMLAEDLVRMGFARMQSAKPIEPLSEDVDDTVLVVGGGRAGMEAALAAAGMGHSVVLVEKTDALGGRLAAQLSVFPEEPPYEEPQENTTPKLIEEVSSNDHIKVLTSTASSSASQRFRRESRVLARLSHPNLPASLDVGRIGVGGGTLDLADKSGHDPSSHSR